MKIVVLDTGVNSAINNMAIDQKLLSQLNPNGSPILHLYEWENESITYGYFTKPELLLDLSQVKQNKIELAKRITGGGVTFHFSDWAFSFLMPRNHPHFSENTLDNYAFVNQFVIDVVAPLLQDRASLQLKVQNEDCKLEPCMNFCMAKPTPYDVIYRTKKIGGAAQRKTNLGYLHHGTISIALPDPMLLKDILVSKEDVFEAIYQNSHYFIKNHREHKELERYRLEFKKRLIEKLQEF